MESVFTQESVPLEGEEASPPSDAPDTLQPASWTSQGPHRPPQALSISLDSQPVLFWIFPNATVICRSLCPFPMVSQVNKLLDSAV